MSKKLLHSVVVTAFALVVGLSSVQSAFAASPSPKASTSPKVSPVTVAATEPSPTPSVEQTTQKLKERIERVVEEKREQIKGVLEELTDKRRGFVGEVQRVSEESITLKTRKATHIVAISKDLQVTKQGKVIPVTDVAVGDWAIVVGSLVDDELQPQRMIISSTSLLPKAKTVVVGNISAVSKTKITLTPRSTPDTKDFLITKTTKYQDLNGNPIKATDVTADVQALVVAQDGTTGPELKVIRILAPLAAN